MLRYHPSLVLKRVPVILGLGIFAQIVSISSDGPPLQALLTPITARNLTRSILWTLSSAVISLNHP